MSVKPILPYLHFLKSQELEPRQEILVEICLHAQRIASHYANHFTEPSMAGHVCKPV